MDDDGFNSILHKLQFQFKLNIDDFYKSLDILLATHLNEIQKINLFYTLYAIGRVSIWFKYLITILPQISVSIGIELCKMVMFHKIPANDVHLLYEYMINKLESEEDVMKICFMETGFFKPIASSHIRTFKSIPQETLQILIELVLQKITKPENFIFTFERILSFRSLTEKEQTILETISVENVSGKLIDILLRTGIPKFIAKAHTLTHESESNILLKDHGSHYFKISPDARAIIESSKNDIINSVSQVVSFANKFTNSINLIQNTNLVLTSGYKDPGGLTLEQIFDYIWQTCNNEQKLLLVNELNSYEAICCSGFVTNLLAFAGALFNKEFLIVDNDYITRQNKIDALRKEFPPEHDIWLDDEKLGKLLSE